MIKTITAEELKEKMDNNEDIVIIETLLPGLYEQWHIPGAINIPADDMRGTAPGRLNKDDEIVLYCRNLACGASDRAADTLEEMGYVNITIYRGGKEEWKDKSFPVES